MEYKLEVHNRRAGVEEFAGIFNSMLRDIQNRRGSPKVGLCAFVDYDGGPLAILATGPDIGMSRRIFQMSLLPNAKVVVHYMTKWKEVAYGYSSMQRREEVCLHDPDSIERIRGMIDKSCRVLANTLASKARRKYEPSAKGRSGRPKLGRQIGRFSSV